MIISASRRTDIPAFYTPWFMNRIREGFLLTRNPYNFNQVRRVSLNPADVDVIVFWTRNPKMLMRHLGELDERGFHYYFQYTITGYPKILEGSVPRPHRAIDTFIQLSDNIGADKVIWRYDPILVSNIVDIDEHKRLFSKIATLLRGKTKRVVISFADLYKKTESNLAAVPGLQYEDIVNDRLRLLDLAQWMATIARDNNMVVETCSEDIDLYEAGIGHGKCIDDRLINAVFGLPLDAMKDPGQREACGCIRSIDIGTYNTCLHDCSYCYATFNKQAIANNKKKHDPESPFLVGGTEGVEAKLLLPTLFQGSLF
ncbi:DUF1848 domain-containing protein [Trabulsiella odontotermitis]|uniref:DUF1848 domain-containing protein n=1 Tax=Trabulsiella odontotermitis TaxID=379893 RepID=UPI003AC326DA